MVSLTTGSPSPSSCSTASCTLGSNGLPSVSMRSSPALLEHAEQLGVHELDALAHLLVGHVERGERELEAVEHRQQLLDQALGRALDERGLLAQDALAVVLEVGLDALRELTQVVALLGQLLEIRRDELSRVLLGALVVDDVVRLGILGTLIVIT